MSEQGRQPTEEELRELYEQELKRVRVEDVLLQTVVSLINLGGRKAGLAQGTEDERDLDQLHMAIESSRALLPFVEDRLGADAPRVREALSQLQMAYAQGARGGEAPASPPPPPKPEGPRPDAGGTGPAQSSGRLWVPGQ